mmetsp:Transcript_6094/g.18576  ORF Transcript_6094/g.18576 Transcript_6094/m.18576 type:complete len:277 (+) Transcript_6094:130-960(+)
MACSSDGAPSSGHCTMRRRRTAQRACEEPVASGHSLSISRVAAESASTSRTRAQREIHSKGTAASTPSSSTRLHWCNSRECSLASGARSRTRGACESTRCSSSGAPPRSQREEPPTRTWRALARPSSERSAWQRSAERRRTRCRARRSLSCAQSSQHTRCTLPSTPQARPLSAQLPERSSWWQPRNRGLPVPLSRSSPATNRRSVCTPPSSSWWRCCAWSSSPPPPCPVGLCSRSVCTACREETSSRRALSTSETVCTLPSASTLRSAPQRSRCTR